MRNRIALVLVQDFAPEWIGFHTWQYAAVLVIAAGILLWYVVTVRKQRATEGESRLLLAIFGALIVMFAGLASGLLGPDTQTFARAPGSVRRERTRSDDEPIAAELTAWHARFNAEHFDGTLAAKGALASLCYRWVRGLPTFCCAGAGPGTTRPPAAADQSEARSLGRSGEVRSCTGHRRRLV